MVNHDFHLISSTEEFEAAALELFRYQAEACPPYRQYLELIGCDAQQVQSIEQIPHLPIELFKSCDVYCLDSAPEMVFTSSNTGGTQPSKHSMAELAIYERAFTEGFKRFYGDVEQWSIYGLLPSYLEREGSSLIYMVDKLIAQCGSGGFYLHDHEKMVSNMARDSKPKILLGVSYALWDLAEGLQPDLHDVIVMETGGMKGHREEISKQALHEILCKGLNVEHIHSEYGMAELTSQGYSKGGNIFRTPSWMRVSVRDVNDPFTTLACGARGGINIIDLASIYSCAFIQTQDMGICFEDGSFTIEGRIAHSDIRGCNLLVQ